jgi:hypothetical protein
LTDFIETTTLAGVESHRVGTVIPLERLMRPATVFLFLLDRMDLSGAAFLRRSTHRSLDSLG